jgi:hypothetical protein
MLQMLSEPHADFGQTLCLSDARVEATAVTKVTWVAQSLQRVTSDWMAGVRSPTDVAFSLCVQTGSEAHPAS